MTFSVICLPVSGDDLLNKENFDVALIFAFAIILSHQGRKSVEPFTLMSELGDQHPFERGKWARFFLFDLVFAQYSESRWRLCDKLERTNLPPLFEANGGSKTAVFSH